MVEHPVAVDIAAGATEIVVTDLDPGNLRVDIEEVAVAVLVEDIELFVFGRVVAERADIGAMGEENDIRLTDDALAAKLDEKRKNDAEKVLQKDAALQ